MQQSNINVYFEDIQQRIVETLEGARYSIKVAVAWFSDPVLIAVLKEKLRVGVSVEVIISQAAVSDGNYDEAGLRRLQEAGAELFQCGASSFWEGGIMHHKFCIVDYRISITGSYNWTKQARRNDENIAIIEDAERAEQFNEQFLALKRAGNVLFLAEDGNGSGISFTATKNLVDPGQPFELHWEVDAADEVVIEPGVGAVKTSGNYTISIIEDRLFQLTAQSGGAVKTKSLLVRIIQPPVLEVSLAYTDANSRQALRLFPIGDQPDRYAVIEGQVVHVIWTTRHADQVVIGGKKAALSGKFSFAVNQPLTLNIEARGIKEIVRSSFSISPIKIPVLNRVISPLPGDIRLEADLHVKTTTVPSNFTLTGHPLRVVIPSITELKAQVISKQPTLRDIARKTGVSVSQLRRQQRNLRSTRQGVLSFLRESFAHHGGVMNYLKNLMKRHA